MAARSARPRRPPAAPGLRLALTSLALGALVQTSPGQARQQDPPFPSEQELRELQQLVFACGRENSSGPCGQARRRADPLLDHPRLPGSCKDVLWQIGQQAVVAGTNSFSRRDQLDRLGLDLVKLCQQRRPQPAPTSPGPGGANRRPMFGPSPSSSPQP
ncbi:MAG: hypothetical protein KFB97_02510 [Cyanobium sp. M30B3]|nr:MAG: hypothetical protein KFB97_02510 [Cyanobium sp. M30B3]